ncbi:flavin reductase family protein [Hyalangium minutum]|uniref:NAD(P)H-flavin oxidoreductase n=1 Tax=Hyalangium minutum TaxID=394096 RepID=A0A085WQY8_9BACT|nr:flavin reductase family protein [Hyalangium minutum]KFE70101.1 NAD(P)H-flavin oxidoreductase [Hyalangium minutum]
MRVPVELSRCARFLNPGPTTLITSAAGGRTNVMTAAWVMAVDFTPPKLAAVIAEGTLTRELVDASGEFVVALPTLAMIDTVYAVGHCSGRDVDKFATYGLQTASGSIVRAPLVEGCVAWLECRVLPEPGPQQRYDLFVAEIVAAWVDDEVYVEGEWRFTRDEHRMVHHTARGVFFATGQRVEAGRRS